MQRISKGLIFQCAIFLSVAGFAQGNPTDTITRSSPIVMVGNSITHHGDWQKVLGRSDVTNWGIPGYTTEQISWTLKTVIGLHPKVCFLEGGINDITLGIAPDRTYRNQRRVMDTLLAHGIVPVLQATIYQYNSSDGNKRVKKVNKLLEAYCRQHHIAYLDLNSVLSDDKGLKKELTTDGTHLQPEAYVLWAVLVKKELAQLGL